MAPSLPAASVVGGAAARLSLAEMMEVRGGWVAPRGLGSDSVPGGVYGLRGHLRRKPVPGDFASHQFTARLHISRVIVIVNPRERCIPSSVTPRTRLTQRCA